MVDYPIHPFPLNLLIDLQGWVSVGPIPICFSIRSFYCLFIRPSLVFIEFTESRDPDKCNVGKLKQNTRRTESPLTMVVVLDIGGGFPPSLSHTHTLSLLPGLSFKVTWTMFYVHWNLFPLFLCFFVSLFLCSGDTSVNKETGDGTHKEEVPCLDHKEPWESEGMLLVQPV
jgi:hypothetical protein